MLNIHALTMYWSFYICVFNLYDIQNKLSAVNRFPVVADPNIMLLLLCLRQKILTCDVLVAPT